MTGQRSPDRSGRRTGLVLGFAIGAAVALLLVAGVSWAVFGPEFRASVDPGRPLSEQERRGEAIYAASCQGCHGGPTGGTMADYPPRHNASGHTWHHPDCQLERIVREGSDEMTRSMRANMAPAGASPMPAFGDRLSDDEIDAVLSYIKLLWTPQQRSVQAQVTSEICVAG
ncbi:MAG: c-type cytochrome [Candidatus Limnocylindria bacterium]